MSFLFFSFKILYLFFFILLFELLSFLVCLLVLLFWVLFLFLIFLCLIEWMLYFTNFMKNIKAFCIKINPVKKFAVRMFFHFCLPFVFFVLISLSMAFSSISTANLCSEKYVLVLTLLFFKALCCSFIFSCRKCF